MLNQASNYTQAMVLILVREYNIQILLFDCGSSTSWR